MSGYTVSPSIAALMTQSKVSFISTGLLQLLIRYHLNVDISCETVASCIVCRSPS